MRVLLTLSVALFLALFQGPAVAAKYQNLGDYQIHYNAFPSTFLSPEMAKLYQIRRSGNRGVLTVSVLESQGEGAELVSVPAEVEGHAVNLTGQLKNFTVREVRDREAIYHIAEFRFVDGETLDFTLRVTPPGAGEAVIRFRQQFHAR